jgi:hypothetical protein
MKRSCNRWKQNKFTRCSEVNNWDHSNSIQLSFMTNMFFQTWVKYVPVLRILLKRSSTDEQSLQMNSSDFHRAAGGRKVKYNFSFALHLGKLQNLESAPPLGRDLIDALQDDVIAWKFVKENHLEFTLNKNFQLQIKNTTPGSLPGKEEKDQGLTTVETEN